MFDEDGTYGPKANFKISLRELPGEGRFRVTVTAAKYDDGLLLDPGADPVPNPPISLVRDLATPQTVNIAKPGIYQVDLFAAERTAPPPPDASRIIQSSRVSRAQWYSR